MNPQPQDQEKPTTPTPAANDGFTVSDSTQPTSGFDGADANSNVEANEAALQAIESLESESNQPETEGSTTPVSQPPVTPAPVSTPEAPATAIEPTAPVETPTTPADQPANPTAAQPVAPFPTQHQPSSKRTWILLGAVVVLVIVGVVGYFVLQSL